MTTEEKAKAYDKALEWMRKVYPTLTGADKEDAEYYFPELKESEDERIRKIIYKLMLGMREEIFTSQDEIVTKGKVLAYLEKQKEQKPDTKLTGWVARDRNGEIYVYGDYPQKDSEMWLESNSMLLDRKSFPNIKWENEPVEVEITIRKQ